mmetsp:Transcript_76749/g.136054  ORF Transcript_76749/g.136054 Transcript_76749/m.136054 type:complete len:165 (-) Transcript_76749:67-561(-)
MRSLGKVFLLIWGIFLAAECMAEGEQNEVDNSHTEHTQDEGELHGDHADDQEEQGEDDEHDEQDEEASEEDSEEEEQDPAEIMQEYDLDADGKLSLEEIFSAEEPGTSTEQLEWIKEEFEKADANHDRLIDVSELPELLDAFQAALAEEDEDGEEEEEVGADEM